MDRKQHLQKLLGDGVTNIGHRGARGLAPENTLVSFLVGNEYTNTFELDVMLCKTKEPVVIHDFTLDRTTNGKGFVAEKTWKELSGLDAGAFFSEEFAGETIPLLTDIFENLPENTAIDIELKTQGKQAERETLLLQVVTVIRKFKIEGRIWLTSFDWELIRDAKDLAPELLRGLLLEPNQSLPEDVTTWEPDLVLPHVSSITTTFMDHCNSLGIPVIPYTANKEEEWKHCISLGVRGIITDYPDRLESYLGSSPTTQTRFPKGSSHKE